MLFDGPETGVVIADGRSGLRLSCVGEANELEYPTLINVRAGPFSGSIIDDTVTGFLTFVKQLENLYETLSGTAKLNSYEGFRLSMTGDGHGGIAVSVVTIGEHVFSIKLTFEFAFDQTYLSGIIRAVHREFRPVVWCIILKFCTIKGAHAALADEDYKMKSPSVRVAASVCGPGANTKRWSAIIGVPERVLLLRLMQRQPTILKRQYPRCRGLLHSAWPNRSCAGSRLDNVAYRNEAPPQRGWYGPVLF